MSLIATALGAIGGAISQFGGTALNYISSRNTNKKNASIAAANNATIMELANTAHQREVADLKASGLNPILSAGGTGAATPALQQPDLKAPQIDPYVTTDLIKTLSEAKLNESQVDINKKTLDRIDVENLKDAATTKYTQAQAKWQEIQNDIAKGTKKAEIQKKYQELDNLISQFDDIQATIHNKQTNTAYQKSQLSKYEEITNEQINKLKAETKYTNERARGYSRSGSTNAGWNGHVGPSGLGLGQNDGVNYSQTW